jgi:hypothetical protein
MRRFQKYSLKRRLALGSPASKPLLKAIYATTGIKNLLLAGKERMTLGTDINMDVLAQGRTGLNDVATATRGRHLTVLGMNIGFHCFAP